MKKINITSWRPSIASASFLAGAILILLSVILYVVVRHFFYDYWFSFFILGKLGLLSSLSYISIIFMFVGVFLVFCAGFLKFVHR